MNFGVEARVPYLDNFFYKIFILFSKNGFVDTSKKILRDLLFKKSNLRIKEKLAFQNYMNKEKKNKIIKFIENKLLPTSQSFQLHKKK